MTTTPRVTIGLPVYNGEVYLAEALDSLLAQTYRDFELVISDNASTDSTPDICRARAERDPRVVYLRNETNVGAMHNFNLLVGHAHGEYFKWAAHDDVHEPTYLERCVAVLDSDPGVVLAHALSRDVDDHGHAVASRPDRLAVASPRTLTRFRDLIRREHSVQLIFGVMRTAVLRETRLLANYADCDRVLLTEIGLAGRFHETPEELFIHREHRARSTWQYTSRQTRSAWFDPARAGAPAMPYSRQGVAYLGAILRAPISWMERLLCFLAMGVWLLRNASGLWEDVLYALRFHLRPIKRRLIPSSGGEAGASGRHK
ncbi:MAG TPA: glycosyltransferase family 2 protein [Candidatus Krumholzibacteria bacterium]|nr:glycosyltransferase family 2 protein [Candidatus Krumholzibacteria bacterium]